jgi:hypothetical protein
MVTAFCLGSVSVADFVFGPSGIRRTIALYIQKMTINKEVGFTLATRWRIA